MTPLDKKDFYRNSEATQYLGFVRTSFTETFKASEG